MLSITVALLVISGLSLSSSQQQTGCIRFCDQSEQYCCEYSNEQHAATHSHISNCQHHAYANNLCPTQYAGSNFQEQLEESQEHNLGGQLPGGQFPGGQSPGGQFPGGQFEGGQFPGGQFPGGQFPGGQFPGGQFQGGQFPGGQFQGGTPFSRQPFTSYEQREHICNDNSGCGTGQTCCYDRCRGIRLCEGIPLLGK